MKINLDICQSVLDVLNERNYQLEKWGNDFDDTHNPFEWVGFINQYASRNLRKFNYDTKTDLVKFRNDMVKVSAIALAAIEACDRAAVTA